MLSLQVHNNAKENACKYKVTDGHVDTSGQEFEMKAAALLFARGINTGQGFKIALNMEAAGKFDDIIFMLQSGHRKTIFMQLKHKTGKRKKIHKSHLLQLTGDYSLLKYCASYCKMKQNWAQNEDLELCGSIEDSAFVIYTNATMADVATGKSECSSVWEELVSSGGKYSKFTRECHPDIYDLFNNMPVYKELVKEAIESEKFTRREKLLEVIKKLEQ
jgi:hypothetical protein